MQNDSRLSADHDDAAARLRHLLPLAGPARACAIIPAAGRGSRSGLALPKQYARLGAGTILARSARTLAGSPSVGAVLIVLEPGDTHWHAAGLDKELADLPQVVAVRIGGDTRRASVLAGCELLRRSLGPDADPWVLVHDAARPGLSPQALDRLLGSAQTLDADGAILALPIADTIKRAGPMSADGPAIVSATIDRSACWAAQTPQMFRLERLISAYTACPTATDEAAAIEAGGGRVALIPGEAINFKLTHPEDFALMDTLLSPATPPAQPAMAIGQGFDVHALVVGRPLIIGGVTIPFDRGLDGHSDADVLLHAITDAILGAACMGDIGRHFPDSDPAYRGADSAVLLTEVVARVHGKGWRVVQIDATVIAQAPRISPHAQAMQQVIGRCCGIDPQQVNIKGKTTERLGFTGRGEGIAAQAVAMLMRSAA
jgi:2-C-methyl-D-erythritol 4-phosphate cytidylyltransferase/2-C-methyl-D-erythritol 2,4-cyclodiphosphate synthase